MLFRTTFFEVSLKNFNFPIFPCGRYKRRNALTGEGGGGYFHAYAEENVPDEVDIEWQ